MADSRWWKDFDSTVTALRPPPARVLDVGCGDGGLVGRLEELGFDALGVDPAAPAHPRLIRDRVQDAEHLGTFDAVITVMVLHHGELDAVVAAISKLLRPHGKLFVYDFDWNAYDDRAASWLAEHDSSGADNSVPAWRAEHGSLHTGAAITQTLREHFTPVHAVTRPYLARMLARPDLEAAEQTLIDAQLLPALGFWITAERPQR